MEIIAPSCIKIASLQSIPQKFVRRPRIQLSFWDSTRAATSLRAAYLRLRPDLVGSRRLVASMSAMGTMLGDKGEEETSLSMVFEKLAIIGG